MRLMLIFLLAPLLLHALPFTLIKHEGNETATPTLLVIGGIHGNEPGSYFAASILAQYYTISKGALWVIPNLNKQSILMNSRGINGDMNRKFANILSDDPDIPTVDAIKSIITDPKVDLILNLHDGHGFYRKEYKNTIFNPGAWGQTCVIDQETLDCDHPYKDLDKIATAVSRQLNGGLIEIHHSFDVRNTNTRFDDEAMKHSLTFFSINHNKPAFAIETSKNLPTLHEKVFYQLNAMEGYMRYMGIEYNRSFELSSSNIEKILGNNGYVTINNKIKLNLSTLKNDLSFIPLESNENSFEFSHPLGGVRYTEGKYDLYIGNKKIASLAPSIHTTTDCGEQLAIETDGNSQKVDFAKEYKVNADVRLISDSKTRVNIIGFTREGKKDESNIHVSLKDLDTKYSVDKDSKTYRAEFYRENDFCGMVLIHYN